MIETNPEAVKAPTHEQKGERKVDYFRPFKLKWADAWMVLFTAVIAATGLAGFINSRGQLIVMQRQLDEMRSSGEDTKLLIKATQDHAKVAQAAVETTKQQLRAYVAVESVSVSFNGTKITPTAAFRNAGQTPAYDLSSKMFVYVGNPNGKVINVDVNKQDPSGKIFVGPNISFSHGGELDISNFIDVISRDPNATIIIYGSVVYRDIFGAHHTTNYKRRRVHIAGETWSMVSTPDGNESD